MVLEQKVTQHLYDFNPDAKQLARDTRKLQLQRARCLDAKNWPCMAGRNVIANASLVPSMDQTCSVLLNHPDNDPYNRPTVIKVLLVPEMFANKQIDIDYRYAVEVNGELQYPYHNVKINRASFPLPTRENDFRYGMFQAHFERWNESVATLTKADKKAFNKIQYKWETTVALFEGQDWNQFQKDFIRSRYSARESQMIKSYK